MLKTVLFTLLLTLGAGAAHDTVLDRDVALKILPPE